MSVQFFSVLYIHFYFVHLFYYIKLSKIKMRNVWIYLDFVLDFSILIWASFSIFVVCLLFFYVYILFWLILVLVILE